MKKIQNAMKGLLVTTAIAMPVNGAIAQADRPDISIAVNKLARSLDPGKQTGTVDVRVFYSIFDTLIRRDFNTPAEGGGANLVPGLATSWERIDSTTIELKLREGVMCHDGNPFDADDVLATFSPERLIGDDAYFPKGKIYFGELDTVEKIDSHTVRFNLSSPDLIFEQRLSSYTSFVICDEAWNSHKVEGEDAAVWMDRAFGEMKWNPVGTGPYMADSYRKNDHIRLASHDDYWGGTPAAASITFRSVPEVSARIAGLVSGEYQMIVEVPPDQWDILARYDDIVTKSVTLDNSHVLVFNTAHPVLENKLLRQAMSLAIDRQLLIDSLWRGRNYTPLGHQLESFGPMFQADREGYAFDLERAKQLVAESGYDGEEIVYRLIPGYYLNNLEAAQAIQEMWRTAGINATLEFVESFKAVRDTEDPPMVYAWSNTYRLPDPTGAIFANWGPVASTQAKYGYFQPPQEFNDLAMGLFSETDMATRSASFGRMLDIFEDDMPMTILYNPVVSFSMKDNIDWNPYSLFFMDFRPDNFSVK